MNPLPVISKKMIKTIALHLFFLLGVFIIIVPLIYAASASLKPITEIFTFPVKWIPSKFQWNNYIEPFQNRPFARYFFNSIFVSSVITLTNLFFCSLAGYSLAKFNFPSRNFLFVLILSTLMLPIQVTMVPLYLLVRSLGWLNSYKALIIPEAMSAFSVFLMRQHIQTIPNDFIDAARVDGCGEFGIFWRIILPMSKPALSAMSIFIFMGSWESFLWPLVTIDRDELRTLALGLVTFQQEYYAEFGQLFAMSLLSMLPILVLFIFLQRKFVEGMFLTGIKG